MCTDLNRDHSKPTLDTDWNEHLQKSQQKVFLIETGFDWTLAFWKTQEKP